jgi:hypothetical protein
LTWWAEVGVARLAGMSEGEYVSLGYYERDDLKALIAHLR